MALAGLALALLLLAQLLCAAPPPVCSVCTCVPAVGTGLVRAECQGKGLSEVPLLDESIAQLNMSKSNLGAVKAGAFVAAGSSLLWLDLSTANITELHPDAFAGLSQLQTLSISFNGLRVLPPRLLEPVGATLTALAMDETFVRELPWGFYDYVPQLKTLSYTGRGFLLGDPDALRHIKPGAFDRLTNLEFLDLARHFHLQTLPYRIFDRMGASLEELNIPGAVTASTRFDHPVYFDKARQLQELFVEGHILETAPALPVLPKLTRLGYFGVQLYRVPHDFFANFPKLIRTDIVDQTFPLTFCQKSAGQPVVCKCAPEFYGNGTYCERRCAPVPANVSAADDSGVQLLIDCGDNSGYIWGSDTSGAGDPAPFVLPDSWCSVQCVDESRTLVMGPPKAFCNPDGEWVTLAICTAPRPHACEHPSCQCSTTNDTVLCADDPTLREVPRLPANTRTLQLIRLPSLARLGATDFYDAPLLETAEFIDTGVTTWPFNLFAFNPELSALRIVRTGDDPVVPTALQVSEGVVDPLLPLITLAIEGYSNINTTLREMLWAMSALEHLSLRGLTQLPHILAEDPTTLHPVPWLHTLDLRDTNLTTLHYGDFHACPDLAHLWLDGNSDTLVTMDDNVFERQQRTPQLNATDGGFRCWVEERETSSANDSTTNELVCTCPPPRLGRFDNVQCTLPCPRFPHAVQLWTHATGLGAVVTQPPTTLVRPVSCHNSTRATVAIDAVAPSDVCIAVCTHALSAYGVAITASQTFGTDSMPAAISLHTCNSQSMFEPAEPMVCPTDAFAACNGFTNVPLLFVDDIDRLTLECFLEEAPLWLPADDLVALELSALIPASETIRSITTMPLNITTNVTSPAYLPHCTARCTHNPKTAASLPFYCLAGAWYVAEPHWHRAITRPQFLQCTDLLSSSGAAAGSTQTIIAGAAGAAAAIIGCALALIYYRRRRQQTKKLALALLDSEGEAARRERVELEVARANALLHDLARVTGGRGRLVERKDLERHEVIGQGNFGQVWHGTLRTTEDDAGDPDGAQSGQQRNGKQVRQSQLVAIKELKSGAGFEEEAKFLLECQLMAALRHPHLVAVVGICAEATPCWLVLEYLSGGDLRSQLMRYRKAPGVAEGPRPAKVAAADITDIARQVADAMAYLETHRVVHRDLACRNLLVGDSLKCVKVGDYGLSRVLGQDSDYYRKSSNGGQLPVRWMAPESISNRRWTSRSDVWSFAITVWEVAALGQVPYGTLETRAVVSSILKAEPLNRPLLCSKDLYEVLCGCWQVVPEDRPNFQQLLRRLTKLACEAVVSVRMSKSVAGANGRHEDGDGEEEEEEEERGRDDNGNSYAYESQNAVEEDDGAGEESAYAYEKDALLTATAHEDQVQSRDYNGSLILPGAVRSAMSGYAGNPMMLTLSQSTEDGGEDEVHL